MLFWHHLDPRCISEEDVRIARSRPATHSRTSSRLVWRPRLPNNCHHTSSEPWLKAKFILRYTVHRGRRRQNRHIVIGQPQSGIVLLCSPRAAAVT